MNRILNYINATLIRLDIPPFIKEQSKTFDIVEKQKVEEVISAEIE